MAVPCEFPKFPWKAVKSIMSVGFFPGRALQSAGAKCNSIGIQILAKQ